MKLPEEFLQSLNGLPGFDREAFVAVHEAAEAPTSLRLNPAKPLREEGGAATGESAQAPLALPRTAVPWCRTGFYLSQRPSFTFDPLFHAGCYYVQEASSMFLEQPLRQLLNLSAPLKVLDLCAAPGGKTTHIRSLLSTESLLVSNEVIKPRSLVLTDNVVRWGCTNVLVSNNDPRAFQKLPGYFDAMVVDAPCSGSGLFRKDEEAVREWSRHNVALCGQRQQRILADALPALKEGGLLVYSTCSYSAEEDEAILDWLVLDMRLESAALNTASFPGIVATASPKTGATGYRFYPDKIRGEGFFLACFRKKEPAGTSRLRLAKPETLSAKERSVVSGWFGEGDLEFVRFRHSVCALPRHLLPDFALLQPLLNLQYAGVLAGEIMKEKLVPHHALAQSPLLSPAVAATELATDDAVRYLQRAELAVQPETTGWQVVRYRGQALGWINALKNRVNNYYPKEIRILKQYNNTAFEK